MPVWGTGWWICRCCVTTSWRRWRSKTRGSSIFREPRRGSILDAHGNLLATSIFVKTVCADPVLIGNQQATVARALAPLLQMSEADLYQRLLPRVRQTEPGETVTNRYVVLRHKVRDETWQQIQTAMNRLSFGPDEAGLSRDQRLFLPQPAHPRDFCQSRG